jgi:hypothetical protein
MLARTFRQYLGTGASFSQNTSVSPSDVITYIIVQMLHIDLSITLEMDNEFTDPHRHNVSPPQKLMTAK